MEMSFTHKLGVWDCHIEITACHFKVCRGKDRGWSPDLTLQWRRIPLFPVFLQASHSQGNSLSGVCAHLYWSMHHTQSLSLMFTSMLLQLCVCAHVCARACVCACMCVFINILHADFSKATPLPQRVTACACDCPRCPGLRYVKQEHFCKHTESSRCRQAGFVLRERPGIRNEH